MLKVKINFFRRTTLCFGLAVRSAPYCFSAFRNTWAKPCAALAQILARYKPFVFILLFFLFSFAYGQTIAPNKFSFGLRAGVNVAQVFGTSSQAFNHFGFGGGVKFEYRFASRWSFDPEILYNMKGAARNPNIDAGETYSFSVDLDYLEVPLMFNYYFGKKRNFSFEFGPSVGFLVRQKAYENGSAINSTTTSYFNLIDLSIAVGFNYHLPKGFSLNVRYMNSVIPIQPANAPIPWGVASFNFGQLNSFFTIALAYKFNFAKKEISETGATDKPVKEKKEKKKKVKKQKGDVIDEE